MALLALALCARWIGLRDSVGVTALRHGSADGWPLLSLSLAAVCTLLFGMLFVWRVLYRWTTLLQRCVLAAAICQVGLLFLLKQVPAAGMVVSAVARDIGLAEVSVMLDPNFDGATVATTIRRQSEYGLPGGATDVAPLAAAPHVVAPLADPAVRHSALSTDADLPLSVPGNGNLQPLQADDLIAVVRAPSLDAVAPNVPASTAQPQLQDVKIQGTLLLPQRLTGVEPPARLELPSIATLDPLRPAVAASDRVATSAEPAPHHELTAVALPGAAPVTGLVRLPPVVDGGALRLQEGASLQPLVPNADIPAITRLQPERDRAGVAPEVAVQPSVTPPATLAFVPPGVARAAVTAEGGTPVHSPRSETGISETLQPAPAKLHLPSLSPLGPAPAAPTSAIESIAVATLSLPPMAKVVRDEEPAASPSMPQIPGSLAQLKWPEPTFPADRPAVGPKESDPSAPPPASYRSLAFTLERPATQPTDPSPNRVTAERLAAMPADPPVTFDVPLVTPHIGPWRFEIPLPEPAKDPTRRPRGPAEPKIEPN